jgi:hypothetical protein
MKAGNLLKGAAVLLAVALALAGALAACSTGSPPQAHHTAASRSSPSPSPPAAAPAGSSAPASASPVATHAQHQGPAATVRAYFRAINNHDYARAWYLGGRYTGSSYSAFISGFQGTAHDKVTILSAAGKVVTARLAARQTDGSERTYQGTYRVTDGVITQFNVASVGGSSGGGSGCYPEAPSGNCYEPGEFCPEADAGMTGVAGDGKTITCELVSGRYHWKD